MIICSDYSLENVLHEGEYAQVFRGWCGSKPVVLKILKISHLQPDQIAWLQREFSLGQRLQSPRVLVPYAFEWLPLSPSQPALIMADGGESLAQRLPIATMEQFLPIAIAITEAVQDVHGAGLIHKDINPSNILLEGDQVRLIDFGIASLLTQEPTPFSHPTQIEGTLPYLAPEQTGRLDCTLDARADLYALGITFYELLTGQLPFTARDPLGWLHVHLAQQPQCPETMPLPLQAIILKLLRKQPAERYPTATALLADLRQLQRLYPERLAEFRLSEAHHGSELRFSGSLFGRDRERAILRQHFTAAVQGEAAAVLVGGISGVGKTALVRDLYEPITLAGGLVAAGKYDQHRQAQPYAAFGQALDAVARLLLIESDAALAGWRERLQAALGATGHIITTIAPLWQVILGPQPPLAPLGWQESENRIQQTICQFIGALACATQPLVLFLDDLQWADAASLALLKSLSQAEPQYCLVIGAYRSNEVTPDHPLLTVPIATRLVLNDLSEAEISAWLADSLQQPDCDDLAHFIYQKTAGNPFFSRELVQQLWRQQALYYDQGWQWSSVSLAALDLSDNIIDFMTRRLQELSPASLTVLSVAACLGTTFTTEILARCLDLDVPALMTQLQPCLAAGLVIPLDSRYKLLAEGVLSTEVPFRFVHDRVQQAAYQLLPNPEMTHLTVGRVLQFVAPTNLLAIVNHLNIGLPLISQPETLAELAGLNQQAGHLANRAAAFDLALACFRQSLALYTRLNRERDATYHSLILDAAEAAALIGAYADVENWLAQSAELMGSITLQARACQIAVMAAVSRGERQHAIDCVVQFLEPLGIDLSISAEATTVAIKTISERLLSLTPTEIIQLPDRHTPESLASIELLAAIIPACFNVQPQRLPLVITQLLRLSLEYGNVPLMAFIYATYGLLNGTQDLHLTQKVITITETLLDHFGEAAAPIRGRTLHVLNSFLAHWLEPLGQIYPRLLPVYHLALEHGDHEFASYAIHVYCLSRLVASDDLVSVSQDFATYQLALTRLQAHSQGQWQRIWAQAVANLIATDCNAWELCGEWYDDTAPSQDKPTDALIFYVLKAFLAYIWSNYTLAATYLNDAAPYESAGTGLPFMALLTWLRALVLSAQLLPPLSLPPAIPEPYYEDRLRQTEQQYKRLPGCEHRLALLDAEALRRAGQWREALTAYNRAIDGALGLNLFFEAAVAAELAVQMLIAHGQNRLARMYLGEVRLLYSRWGATAKLAELEERYPRLFFSRESTGTQRSNLDSLNSLSVLKASQALAEAIDLNTFLRRMLAIALESAGAEKGFLCLPEGLSWQIRAQGELTSQGVYVQLEVSPCDREVMLAAINYVRRTLSTYTQSSRRGAAIALPLLYQGQLLAVLYLENEATTQAFSPSHLAVLNLLSGQIASSLHNAQLYQQLQDYSQTLEQKVSERTAALQSLNRELERRAMIDGLTNVANRFYFDQYLQEQCLNQHQSIALILFDVDYFKQYNDAFGHPAGDRCLMRLAQLSQDCRRTDRDLVARYGGEEFALILPGCDQAAALQLAERLQARLAEAALPAPGEICVTISIGIASLIPQTETDAALLLVKADTALYKAKDRGRNCIVVSER